MSNETLDEKIETLAQWIYELRYAELGPNYRWETGSPMGKSQCRKKASDFLKGLRP